MSKVYAVKEGRAIGIFNSWDECSEQVKGYPGAKFKSFKTREEANEYLGITLSQGSNSSDKKLDELKWLLQTILESNEGGDIESVKNYIGNISDLFEIDL